jgi:predicted transcriptional regulator
MGAHIMNLGELEKAVLHFLWESPEVDAKTVFAHFEKQRGGTLNTIQSTLDRLYKKKLLLRNKSGHAFQYRPAQSKSAFLGLLINNVTKDFIDDEQSSLVAAFASVSSDISDDELDQLADLIEQRRAKKSQ